MDLDTSLNDLIENSSPVYYDIISWLVPWLNQYLIIKDVHDNGVIKCIGRTSSAFKYGFTVEIYYPGETHNSKDVTIDKWTLILYGISREKFDLSDPNCFDKILQTLKEHKQID